MCDKMAIFAHISEKSRKLRILSADGVFQILSEIYLH